MNDIWELIGIDEGREELRNKSALMIEIEGRIKALKLTQSKAARVLGISRAKFKKTFIQGANFYDTPTSTYLKYLDRLIANAPLPRLNRLLKTKSVFDM